MIMVLASCQPYQSKETTSNNKETTVPPAYPELLTEALNAHGGIEQWAKYRTLSYTVENTLGAPKTETQLIDLNTRKVRITGDNYTIGMDGNNVWVAPDKAAFGKMSARFYHNLVFYFFAIPYVLADPGIIYEDMGLVTISGKKYRALKISYNGGVGDTADDEYIAHFNPETYKLELLLYTVTYFSGQKQIEYNCLMYNEWQTVNGLEVPASFEGRKYENGEIGEKRYEARFTNVLFDENAPDISEFTMPELAEIDSLINN